MSYIKKHWRGEYSLARSFWINVLLINIGISAFETWLTAINPIENPVTASQVTLVYLFFTLALIYPWQMIGLWRSAQNHTEATKKVGWSRAVKFLAVLGVLGTLVNLSASWPVYQHLYQVGFKKDQYGDYSVEFIADKQLIHIRGNLGFGIAQQVERLLAQHPSVHGVILDSVGGRIYEGRALAKIILRHGLNTYSLKGCYSACGTAFIAGKQRYLAEGANLAFHQYNAGSKGFDALVDLSAEQKKDLDFYKQRGVKQAFIDRIFKAENDDLWYPTINEMIDSGVVDKVVSASTLKPVQYTSINVRTLDDALNSIPAFQTIEAYEPKIYQGIITALEERMQKGGSALELQQVVGEYIQLIAAQSLPKTSTQALLMFAEAAVDIMKSLEKQDPILCIKHLFPEEYGALDIVKHLSSQELDAMMDSLNRVIIDSYGTDNPVLDSVAAEKLMAEVLMQLGEDAAYLEAAGLQNKAEYSQSCKTFIQFYEAILVKNNQAAGNGLRYVFGP